jgi:hypothetical protein
MLQRIAARRRGIQSTIMCSHAVFNLIVLLQSLINNENFVISSAFGSADLHIIPGCKIL